MARPARSISLTIVLGASSIALSIAMLVGWVVVILQNSALTREVAQNTWLLAAGSVSLVVIMSVLMLFSVFLVRETLEIRRQDSFIDSVTHELKSPLASLKLSLQTIDRPGLDAAQQRDLRQMMLDDIERLAVFIDDVLQASRLNHKRPSHAFAEVDLATLAVACAETVCRRHRLASSAVRFAIEPGLRLQTDRTALETILKNLIDNAIKYSDATPDVWVAARRERQRLILEVRDRGIGVPANQLKRIFERFYRVQDEAVRSRRGTGLGLFVVAALVRGLGGRLRATSAGLGSGTCIVLRLPLGQRP